MLFGTLSLRTIRPPIPGRARLRVPKEREEPLVDAAHARNAIAPFNQVEGVSNAERDRAWKRIRSAAKKFDVDVSADDWRELSSGGR